MWSSEPCPTAAAAPPSKQLLLPRCPRGKSNARPGRPGAEEVIEDAVAAVKYRTFTNVINRNKTGTREILDVEEVEADGAVVEEEADTVRVTEMDSRVTAVVSIKTSEEGTIKVTRISNSTVGEVAAAAGTEADEDVAAAEEEAVIDKSSLILSPLLLQT